MASPVIAPSILASDYSRFGEEAKRAEVSGGDWLHVDIMDGHFVPNISFGPGVVAALRKSTTLPLDVHLMIEHPDRYVAAFAKAGAFRITVHIEAPHEMKKTLQQIRDMGCQAGIALNPATPPNLIEPYLDQIDLVLCMTVVPGFGGQSFMPEVLPKIQFFRDHSMRKKNRYHIEVDGGIANETASQCAKSGADVFVAGTSIFSAKDLVEAIKSMRQSVQIAHP
jgi:ribulose-phosphate 3-epimerase